MDYFSSGLFKISLSMVVFFIIYGIIIFLMKDRILKHIFAQPDEKRLKIFDSFSKLVIIYKILFWMSIIFLVQMMVDLFVHQYEIFFSEISFGIVAFVALIISFLYVHMVLNAMGNRK